MSDLWPLLEKQGEVLTNSHFIYTSGKHGDGYANMRFLGRPEFETELRSFSYELLCRAIADGGLDLGRSILVVGPQTLGAKMAKVAVLEYNRRHDAHIRYATFDATKHDDNTKTFSWATDNPAIHHLCQGAQIIWMDDLLNVASTFARTRSIVEGFAPVMVVAVLFDRSAFSAKDLDVACLVSLERHTMYAYEPEDCLACRDNVPIVNNLGHGAQFQNLHPDYPGGFVGV